MLNRRKEMMSRRGCLALILPLILSAGLLIPAHGSETPAEAELRAPLLNSKLIIAHHMTKQVYGGQLDMINEQTYRPDGVFKSIGGLYHVLPLLGRVPYASVDEARAFEINAALKLGLDGFHFYYPLVGTNSERDAQAYNRYITEFFAAAHSRNLPVKFTLCLSDNRLKGTIEERTDIVARRLRELLATTDGREWLKTPDGRFIFYVYDPFSLIETEGKKTNFSSRERIDEAVRELGRAYGLIAGKAGIRIACVVMIDCPRHWGEKLKGQGKNAQEASALYEYFVNRMFDVFPAVSHFFSTPTPEILAGSDMVAATAKRRGRYFINNVSSEYYMSKVTVGQKRVSFGNRDSLAGTPLDQIKRFYIPAKGSFIYRTLLERAVANDPPMLNYITWNDYPEGHHLAPEINHNYAYSVLLQHYKKLWKHETPDPPEKAAVFFKKSPPEARPGQFDLPFVAPAWLISPTAWEEYRAAESQIEVVTILNDEATLVVNGKPRGTVGKGLVSTYVPLAPGKVCVQVLRGGKAIIDLTAPEWITDKPYRGDRITYAWSSECAAIHKAIFGDLPLISSDEYAEDEQGMPNWKKRYTLSKP